MAEEFAEIFRTYDNRDIEIDECTKQLRAVLVTLLQSEEVTGRQRSNIRVAFLALDENLDNFEEATRRKRAGVPGADENLGKASYELKSSIESIRDLMMEYIKKQSVVAPTTEPQLTAQPKVEAEDKTENQYVERIKSDPEDDTAYNALGNYYFSKGRYEDAIKQYEMAASKKELSVYYSNAGDAYRRLRKWSESSQFYQKALAITPNDDIANNSLGLVFFEQGKYEEAKKYYLEAISKNPEPVYFVNMGLALVMQNKLDEGVQYYENALMINPDNASAHAELAWANLTKYYAEGPKEKALLDEALNHYKESLRIDPNQLGYFHYCGLGEVYSQYSNWDKAIEYYEKSIELGPDHSRAYNGIGNVYFSKGEYPKAREYYQKALEKNPNYYIYAENIGRCHKQLREWEQAVIYFKKALELNPRDSVTLSGLGEMFYQMGKNDEASRYFGEAIKIDPNNFLHHYWMGMVSSAQAQWDMAIPYFRKAIELNPQDDYSYYSLGFAYFGKGLLREATESLLKAISIRPTDPLYYTRLSQVYSRSRMWDEATKYAKLADEKAKAINPNDDSYKLSLARVYNDKGLYLYNSGRYAESVIEYRQALNIKEEDVYHWNLYLAYKKMNDPKQAKKSLARAIQLKPDERMYLEELEKV